jgi:hypothetical protein
MLRAMRGFLRESDMMAYLAMMTVRLIELHRVLKRTGSLYLHCDPTASHYLKIMLDAVFGAENFRNEIIWKRTSAHSASKRWGPVHDVILFYSSGERFTWNKQFQPYEQSYVDAFYTHKDADGRRWRRSDLTGAGTRSGTVEQLLGGAKPKLPPLALEAAFRKAAREYDFETKQGDLLAVDIPAATSSGRTSRGDGGKRA